MLCFATFFDINYLSRGLALLASLTKHSSQTFKLYILALDEDVVNYFEVNRVDSVSIIQLKEIEDFYPELSEAKKNRSTIEYYFTLSPYLPLYILNKYPDVDQITSMDADIYFFNDPYLILKKHQQASVLITPHNFSPTLTYLLKYGKYNVSFQSFKNNGAARTCLEDWRQKCFNWCYDDYDEDNNRFADQLYLNSWIELFDGVQEIDMPGAGLAPWNINNYQLDIASDSITVDNEPLIYYHFHHLRIFYAVFAINGLENYHVKPNQKAIRYLYQNYLNKLSSFSNRHLKLNNNTLRYNGVLSKKLMERLKTPQGYWVFSRFFISHINPHRRLNQIKRSITRPWQK